MGEKAAIERVDDPVTVSSLVADFRDLGIETGDTLLVHSSLRSIGFVSVGPPAVVDALQEVLTESGTLLMPAFTGQYGDPAIWNSPPVPDDWVEEIRSSRPPFRPAVTPTRGVGAIPECFRNYPGVVRSEHPQFSFAVWGRDAEAIAARHELDDGLGENSPLASVYDRDGTVLMLGTDHDTNTSFHLAEYRAPFPKESSAKTAPLLRDGERVDVAFENVDISSDDFAELGNDFEREVGLTRGAVGAATAKLARQPKLVDFAVEWFEAHRGGEPSA
jgi:aminoglycoside 3-N-acetyltransferase